MQGLALLDLALNLVADRTNDDLAVLHFDICPCIGAHAQCVILREGMGASIDVDLRSADGRIHDVPAMRAKHLRTFFAHAQVNIETCAVGDQEVAWEGAGRSPPLVQ